jgi:hypothetical protein
MGSQQNEEMKYVVDSQHDVRLPGLPSLKGNEERHECQKCKKVLLMGQLMWVRMLPGCSTANANGGLGTAEPGMRILKANIRGCDWKCKCNTVG